MTLAGTDAELYQSACAACHGNDGKGRAFEVVSFETPLPDFTDCEFASREPDPDWYAVIHEGGPVRAFDQMMPAFGKALSADEINRILKHVRTFCVDDRWPRGEFNLPRPLFTEKAFPEDEAVVTTSFDTGSSDGASMELLYEKRIGPVGMVEIALPVTHTDPELDSGTTGIGDIALGYKHTVLHDLAAGNIFSVGFETILPTGDEDEGLGKGSVILEPFATYGRLLPNDSFLQAHVFAELPVEDQLDDELGLRVAVGRTFTTGGPFGRAWSPMVEVLGTCDLVSGAETKVDVVPQLQVALNTRQHILLNVGVRVPVSQRDERDPEIIVYILWDWFDGGFFDGW
jgi:hypothetical protein